MNRSRHAWLASIAAGALAAMVSSSPSLASWPMARQSPSRQASMAGKSDMATPVPYWRTYLGGSLAFSSFATLDVDGDGVDDALYGSGGRIVAKKTTDVGIWQTLPRGIGQIAAIADLDGDGVQDIVSTNFDHVVIVKATTGDVEWTEPDGDMGTLGTVHVGDVDGDGKSDIVVEECGCCGVNNGKTGFGYSFGAGFGAAKLVFTMPFTACGASQAQTLVDVDGDGKQEMMISDFTHFEIYDGKTNTKLATSPTISNWNSVSQCRPENIDGKPGEELVCVINESVAGNRRVSAFKYNASTKALDVLWSNSVAPSAGGDIKLVDLVVDLDGDGVFEVPLSTYDANAGGWKTHVYDALTGADVVPPVAGHSLAGTAQSTKKGSLTLFTNAGTNLYGWTFARAPMPTITQQWQLADRALVTYAPLDRRARYGASRVVVAPDLDNDGLADFVTKATAGSSALVAYSGAGGTTKLLGTRTLPAGVDVQQAWMVPAKHNGDPQLALARTDGSLEELDGTLAVAQCCGEFPQPLVIRVGGYYASGGSAQLTNGPRTFPMKPGAPDSIIVNDSRRSLVRYDAKDASWLTPPVQAWSVPNTFGPTVGNNLDGASPGIACFGTDASGRHVRVLRGDGTTVWDVPVEKEPLEDLVPGNFNGDSNPDFLVHWGDPSDTIMHTRGLSGADGSKLWEAAPVNVGCGRGTEGASVGKWDADPFDDVYQQQNATVAISGANGSLLKSGGTGDCYFMPMLVDTNADGKDEVVLQGGYSPVREYSHDLSTALYVSPDDDRPYPYGAIASCPNSIVLVEGSLQHAGRLKLTQLSGGAAGTSTTMVLASGATYPNEAATNGAYIGQLTSAAVHQNLTGKGRPTALVGSLDGYVYGLDPCAGVLDFAVNLRVATGEIVFGDTDGDGRDEILVSAADGFLYDLKNKAIDSPSPVIDTDPARGFTTVDVDTTPSTTSLSGSWAAVTGATSYSVAIADTKGTLIAPWKDVGVVTATTVSGLSLSIGTRYIFAVRANSTTGPSVDSLSNGVTVVATTVEPSGGADAGPADDGGVTPAPVADSGGCGCDLSGAGSTSALGFAAGALALVGALARRRRR